MQKFGQKLLYNMEGGGSVGCNAQLEGEGTGEDGGQEDRILTNDGPRRRLERGKARAIATATATTIMGLGVGGGRHAGR